MANEVAGALNSFNATWQRMLDRRIEAEDRERRRKAEEKAAMAGAERQGRISAFSEDMGKMYEPVKKTREIPAQSPAEGYPFQNEGITETEEYEEAPNPSEEELRNNILRNLFKHNLSTDKDANNLLNYGKSLGTIDFGRDKLNQTIAHQGNQNAHWKDQDKIGQQRANDYGKSVNNTNAYRQEQIKVTKQNANTRINELLEKIRHNKAAEANQAKLLELREEIAFPTMTPERLADIELEIQQEEEKLLKITGMPGFNTGTDAYVDETKAGVKELKKEQIKGKRTATADPAAALFNQAGFGK